MRTTRSNWPELPPSGKSAGPLAKRALLNCVSEGDAALEDAAKAELENVEFLEDPLGFASGLLIRCRWPVSLLVRLVCLYVWFIRGPTDCQRRSTTPVRAGGPSGHGQPGGASARHSGVLRLRRRVGVLGAGPEAQEHGGDPIAPGPEHTWPIHRSRWWWTTTRKTGNAFGTCWCWGGPDSWTPGTNGRRRWNYCRKNTRNTGRWTFPKVR